MIEFAAPDHTESVAVVQAESAWAEYVINMLDQDRWNAKLDAKVAQDLICLWNDPATTELVAWIDRFLDQQRSCRQAWVLSMEMEPSREASGPSTHNDNVKLPGLHGPLSAA
jgi:hypothetical protein